MRCGHRISVQGQRVRLGSSRLFLYKQLSSAVGTLTNDAAENLKGCHSLRHSAAFPISEKLVSRYPITVILIAPTSGTLSGFSLAFQAGPRDWMTGAENLL